VTLEVSKPQRIALLEETAVSSLTAGLKVRSEAMLDETVFTVAKEDYRAFCERLYGAGFDFPSSLTGVDMEWGLGVVLHVQQLESKRKATVRVYVPYDEPRVPTVCDLWGGVEWHEREAYDLVGIHFDGHPDHRRILLEDHWTIHPLQRKYNTRGYVIPQWTPKPWPSPAPWEEGFAPFAAATPAAAHTPTKTVAPTGAAPASSPATPSSVAAETKAANEQGTSVTPVISSEAAATEAPKKMAKKWVPKTPAADTVPSSTEAPAAQPAPAEAASPETPKVESSQPETPVAAPVSSDAPAAPEATPEEKPRSPKIKRWEPKS
jgi:NADH:ubiquinone oxidoreductase subunit C